MGKRSASIFSRSRLSRLPPGTVRQHPVPTHPQGPSRDEIDDWVKAVTDAFNDTSAAAKTPGNPRTHGTPIHPGLIYVHDSRPNARSLALGSTTDQSGSDGAGWWIDIQDKDKKALTQLLVTTTRATNLPGQD